MRTSITVGTRGSNLALAQTRIAMERLQKVWPSPACEIKTIATTGDRNQQASLSNIGGKGVFIRELERALLDGSIDIAVHSFKDITARLAEDLELCAFFAPESPCDVLLSRGKTSLEGLTHGARIGTGSMRRRALLSRMRPDLVFADIRGNIETRISKMERGEFDAIVVSEAGLIRLGLDSLIAFRFDPTVFYPSPGQGVIAIEIRKQDQDLRELCRAVGDNSQHAISLAEISLLTCLGFDCRTPLGIYTQHTHNDLTMTGFYIQNDSSAFIERCARGAASAPQELGEAMARLLLEGRE